jgi:hypothetical protein
LLFTLHTRSEGKSSFLSRPLDLLANTASPQQSTILHRLRPAERRWLRLVDRLQLPKVPWLVLRHRPWDPDQHLRILRQPRQWWQGLHRPRRRRADLPVRQWRKRRFWYVHEQGTVLNWRLGLGLCCALCTVRWEGMDWSDCLRSGHLHRVGRLLQPVPPLNDAHSLMEKDIHAHVTMSSCI